MIRDPVVDWSELSALYEQADLLSGSALRDWLAALPADLQRFVPRLERMLAARERVAAEQFLEALPPLHGTAEASSLAWDAGRRVGSYRLVRHAGSGGMAEVWFAQRDDGAFSRTVAIKLLRNHPTRAQRGTFVERFRRERDILASLDHPNIARLHDAGITTEGQPWLALEFIEGKPITAWCDDRRLTIEERVRLFRQVLLAVEHAHARLVIHRDVKPSNVLVTDAGEVRLLDFGIAKLLESEGDAHVATALTHEGGRPLTPQYASPEQLLGEPLTTACDVYSLGVMLHELLTGKLPYELKGKSLSELESAIVDIEPLAPSRLTFQPASLASRRTDTSSLRRMLKPDLDAIVLRALEKSTARRFESVGAMRAELDRWLAHEPVLATVPGVGYRLNKFIRRHRVGVAISTAAACLAFVAAGAVAWQGVRAQREAARALASKDFLLDMFRLSDPNLSKGGSIEAGKILEAGLDRAHRTLGSQPQLRAEVLMGIAEIEQHLGHYTRADAILAEASTIYDTLAEPRERAASRVELADNAMQMGDYDLAAARLDQATPLLTGLGDDRPLRSRAEEVRGWLARAQGRLAEARVHMLASLEAASAAYGAHDNRTADAWRGLAAVESEAGDYDAAIGHIEAAAAVAAAASNATVTDRIGIEIDGARTAFDAGQLAQAQGRIERTLRLCDPALGEYNESCVFLRSLEVLVLLQVGRFADSLEFVPALEHEAANSSSPRRQDEATILAARALAANGLLASHPTIAARLHELAASASAEGLPTDSQAGAQLALTEAELREGRAEQADAWLSGLLAHAERPLPAMKIFSARALLLHGLSLQLRMRHAEALAALREAEGVFSDQFGPRHTNTIICGLDAVPSLVATGEVARALAVVTGAQTPLNERLPADAPLLDRLRKISAELRAPVAPKFDAARRAVFFSENRR
jgi:serine/threonine protein kinase/tetratricopeptide (TPR) repeat protein